MRSLGWGLPPPAHVFAYAGLRLRAWRGKGLGMDDLRCRLYAFLLFRVGAFNVVHTKRDSRKLGEHLLGTFDCLRSRHCDEDVCAAGALHSIYGTSVFKRVTLPPTPEGRAEVQQAFGDRAERLAFLFHVCERPSCLERGTLTSRFAPGEQIEASRAELRDLRLIEAANFVDQRDSLAKLPAIARVWREQSWEANRAALRLVPAEERAGSHRKASRLRRLAAWCPRRAAPRYGIRVRCLERRAHFSLPVDLAELRRWLLAADGSRDSEDNPPWVGFVLGGEGDYGMPPAWPEMLNRFADCACSGYDFELPSLRPLELAPVVLRPEAQALQRPLQLQGQVPRIPLAELRAGAPGAGRALVDALHEHGWAAVVMEEEAVEAMQQAYESMRAVCAALTRDEKRQWQRKFDGSRYVGFARDAGREWIQIRAGMEDAAKFQWPHSIAHHQRPVMAAFTHSEAVGRVACAALLHELQLQGTYPIETLLDGASTTADGPRPFGATVMRLFSYFAGMPQQAWGSSPHADMGLITVAAPSTEPALQLWSPRTGRKYSPEEGLRPNEWVVFPGETLGFITGGLLQAPIHGVVGRGQQREAPGAPVGQSPPGAPRRCSAPLFLRAAPDALLAAPGGEGPRLATRDFMERHAIGPRPWRLASTGDW